MTISVPEVRINNNATSFTGGAYNPIVIKSEKIIKGLETVGKFSTPENRLIMGATALALQPEIDLHNKHVDEKTRKVSAARTIAKIVIGTATGILVRQGCIDLMDSFTKTPEEIGKKAKKILGIIPVKVNKKWETLLIPKGMTPEAFATAARKMSKHRKSLGSIAALGVMLITNFIIDAPLTKVLTNFFVKQMDKADNKKSAEKGGK